MVLASGASASGALASDFAGAGVPHRCRGIRLRGNGRAGIGRRGIRRPDIGRRTAECGLDLFQESRLGSVVLLRVPHGPEHTQVLFADMFHDAQCRHPLVDTLHFGAALQHGDPPLGSVGPRFATDELQLVLEVRLRGGAGSPDVLPLQSDCTDQIQLGQYRPCQSGPECVHLHLRCAVLVVRCEKEEGLGKVQLRRLRRFSVHTNIVAQPGSRHNENLKASTSASTSACLAEPLPKVCGPSERTTAGTPAVVRLRFGEWPTASAMRQCLGPDVP